MSSGIIIPDSFYVYTLIDSIKQRVFYAGKGIGRRVYSHEQEAATGHHCLKCERIRGIWDQGGIVLKRIVHQTDSEQAAYDYERRYIKWYVKRYGPGSLVNLIHGGNGNRARPPDPRIPDKPPLQMTEPEYLAFLARLPQSSQEERDEDLRVWREEKLVLTQHRLWDARRMRDVILIEEETQEIARLLTALNGP